MPKPSLVWYEDPKIMVRLHAWLTFVWIGATIPTLIWWRESILWVAFMSLWANIASHWAAWQAARSECKIDEKVDAIEAVSAAPAEALST